jgi:hypothetical protein
MEPKIKIYLGVFLVTVLISVLLIVRYVKSKKNKDNYKQESRKYETKENFNPPVVSNANILYTDSNGNLGSTSDIGINYLTVSNGTTLSGGTTVDTINATTSISSPTINATTSISSPTINATTSISSPTINATTSISSPTIDTINTTLTDLKTKIDTINTTLTNDLKNLKDNIVVRRDRTYLFQGKGSNNCIYSSSDGRFGAWGGCQGSDDNFKLIEGKSAFW